MKFQVKLQFDKQERKTIERGFHFWGTRSQDLVHGEQALETFRRLVNRLIDGAVVADDLELGLGLLARIVSNVKVELGTLEPYRDSPKPESPHALILDPAMAVATIERCRSDQMKDVKETERLFHRALTKIRPLVAIADQVLPPEDSYDSTDEEEI